MTTPIVGYVVVLNGTGFRDLSWDGELYPDLTEAQHSRDLAVAQAYDVTIAAVIALPDVPAGTTVEASIGVRLPAAPDQVAVAVTECPPGR